MKISYKYSLQFFFLDVWIYILSYLNSYTLFKHSLSGDPDLLTPFSQFRGNTRMLYPTLIL